MNYLAHAYLSFGNDQILLGNMISDFVKGKEQFAYPAVVHKGIVLHRAIDEYTDFHRVTKEAKAVFRPAYRLYSGAFIDVVYDHFLAISEEAFADQSLLEFSLKTYDQLNTLQDVMPDAFRQMFFYMEKHNWLYGYRTPAGMYQSFGGLVKRAAYLQDSGPAIKIFDQHYHFLKDCFAEFWKELKPFAFEKYTQLLTE